MAIAIGGKQRRIIFGSGYRALAQAIVCQAAEDYAEALRTGDARMLVDCERFFVSDWYRHMTDIDGVDLMKALKEAVLDDEED